MDIHIFIIAEAGVNHNGNPDMAFQLVDAAVDAGADAIKFQTFKAENIVTKNAVKADYQKQTTENDESQYSMLKRLELSYAIHHELMNYCNINGIQFLSTAFDFDSLNFLENELKFEILKVPSGEITNGPFLLAHAKTKKNLIVSTGMSTMDEVEEALSVLAFGLTDGKAPSKSAFQKAYLSDNGKRALEEKVTLLHCTSEYPAPYENINLRAMITMKEKFNLRVGYSDHSKGIQVSIAAATIGASIIEKHFTLDKSLPGPDHMSSLSPNEFKDMVNGIRTIEKIMGDGQKNPSISEYNNRTVSRRSIVAACNIAKGDFYTNENITILRPGIGKSPMEYWDLIGKKSLCSYKQDEAIR